MRRNQTYIPKPGSKIEAVIFFLRQMPEHRATRKAISKLCNIEPRNVGGVMEAALSNGWLEVDGFGDMMTYKVTEKALAWKPVKTEFLPAGGAVVPHKPRFDSEPIPPEERLAQAQFEATSKASLGVDYVEVLADLRDRLERIQAAIRSIEALAEAA